MSSSILYRGFFLIFCTTLSWVSSSETSPIPQDDIVLISQNVVSSSLMNYDKAKQKLYSIGQEHLLEGWEALTPAEQERFLQQVEAIDPPTFMLQRNLLREKGGVRQHSYEPFNSYNPVGSEKNSIMGRELLSAGKVGVLIVAGGEGTRLGFEGPKGCFPITNVRNKSLYQLFAEKAVAASQMAGRPLPVAIMTSPCNHKATVAFFEENGYFGLERSQVDFFMQSQLPYLDQKGDMFLEAPGKIAEGPNGNGTSLFHFFDSGLWEKWHRLGVEYLNYVLIDNPLADPFDLELIGYHHQNSCDITIKAVERIDPRESVGVIVRSGGQVHVVEYSEISEEERNAFTADGKLKHPCANISLFCFDMQLVHRTAVDDDTLLPYHLAFKSVKYLNKDGVTVKSKHPIAWKYEKFIFDVLPLASHLGCLVYPRERCFAPLKNREGPASKETVQQALLDNDRYTWYNVAATKPPQKVFELSQQFYYPTETFMQRWHEKDFPDTDYVE